MNSRAVFAFRELDFFENEMRFCSMDYGGITPVDVCKHAVGGDGSEGCETY